MASHLCLVLGGVRSGKSAFAERLALEIGGSALYIATGVATDEEMEERIRRHKESRPAHWTTVEEPLDLAGRLEAVTAGGEDERAELPGSILIDSLDLWVSNMLMESAGPGTQAVEDRTLCRLDRMSKAVDAAPASVFLVSSEVGLSLVPVEPLGRRFQDLLGTVNQRVAAAADSVYLVVAGIPTELKGPGARRGM